MTRCKFTCTSITKRKGFNGHPFVYDAQFQVVHQTSYRERQSHGGAADTAAMEDDKPFWAATPSGTINVGTIAADHFQVGADYYVDFTPVSVPAVGQA